MSRLLGIAALAMGACSPPDLSRTSTDLSVEVVTDVADVDGRFVSLIEGAETSLHVALPTIESPAIADALLAAVDRGVEVEVSTDAQSEHAVGVAALLDAGLDVALDDDALAYFGFDVNADLGWSGAQVQMSHAMAVADDARFVTASRAGELADGPIAVFEGRGEDPCEVIEGELRQIHDGIDATALDAYNAGNKSIPDPRTIFGTSSDERFELHFGPQGRLLKGVIDAVYDARSSVRIVTEDLTDVGLIQALQNKAADGFDVQVIVGASFGSTSSAQSNVLRDQAPDVEKLHVLGGARLPTVVYVDFDPARDGRYHTPTVMVLTHPLYSASRLFGSSPVVTDQYIDGTMVVMSVADVPPSPPLQALAAIHADAIADVEVLP